MNQLLQPTFRVDYEHTGEVHRISLAGEMDMSNIYDAHRSITLALNSDDEKPVVIDMSELHFIDSHGIRLLMETQAASRADSDRVTFRGIQPEVAQTLRVTGVDKELKTDG
jgi:anti-sigma B factor antagonist